MADLVKLAAKLNRLQVELEAVARELLADHLKHDANWIARQKRYLDHLTVKRDRLAARVK